jgi:hypothetical protein
MQKHVPAPARELYQTVREGNVFMRWGLASSEKQIPQIVENSERAKQGLESLESSFLRPRQAGRHRNVILTVVNDGKRGRNGEERRRK